MSSNFSVMTAVSTFRTYWQTLRYLRPVQFYGRAWFKLARPRPDMRTAPSVRARSGPWVSPARRLPSLTGPSGFRFLNEEHSFAEVGWDSPAVEKLWRYNLHYFDDLNSVEADSRTEWHRSLLARWVEENPPAFGTGWEPYPTSVRIVNWVKWALDGNVLAPECVHSLAVQARWLAKRLEWHLLGNHLFVNAKALIFSGLYFSGPEADQWLETGVHILAREIPEQILGDGGQFERSPMYHALALEDVLDLCNVLKAFHHSVPEQWRGIVDGLTKVVGRMRHWLVVMSHPDGEISLFNDAAFGIAPSPEQLDAYARRIGFPALVHLPNGVTHLAQSGYVRVQRGPLVAFLDVAPIGPDYMPGHAHADTLSFELSLHGHRVVVNGGTSRYGLGSERLRERETSAHSTVEVAGQSSSDVWGGFRVGRRAYPFDLETGRDRESFWVGCSHDGYTHLPGKPVHRREWKMTENGLSVTDHVTGHDELSVARYILAPTIRVSEVGEDVWSLALPGGKIVCFRVLRGRTAMEVARYAPEFGKVLETRCLAVKLVAGQAKISLMWS